MARDRQWVVLDQSRNANKEREPAARDIVERDAVPDTGDSGTAAPPLPDSYGPGE